MSPVTAFDVNQLLKEAFTMFSEGQYRQSRRLALLALGHQSTHPGVLQLLGQLACQRGLLKLGARYFERALRTAPGNVELLLCLGEVAEAQGLYDKAMASYLQALQQTDRKARCYSRLGKLGVKRQQYDEAIAYFQKSLEIESDAQVWNQAGDAFYRSGQFQQAKSCFLKSLEIQPDFMTAQFNMAMACDALEQREEAITLLEKVISREPMNRAAYYELTRVCHACRGYTMALDYLQKAMALGLESGTLYNMLGGTLTVLNRQGEAQVYYEKALALEPEVSNTHGNMALCLFRQGYFEAALPHYHKALALDPENSSARFGLGVWHLSQERLQEGWPDYEARIQMDGLPVHQFKIPQWQGETLSEKQTLIVAAEQGYGDNIQFVRLLPLIKQSGVRVVFECLPALMPLLKDYPGIDELVAPGTYRYQALPDTLYAYLLSLPGRLNLSSETIPPPLEPVRWVNPAWAAGWKTRIADTTNTLKVGLVWSSKKGNPTSGYRSCPLELLDVLSDVPGVSWYSLQKECSLESRSSQLSIVDLGPELNCFTDTAGAILNLDLVITVDTAVAHLAGSLDCPTWVLLHKVPDWRWFMDHRDTPWYPATQLYRQARLDDWTDVLATLKIDLLQRVQAKIKGLDF